MVRVRWIAISLCEREEKEVGRVCTSISFRSKLDSGGGGGRGGGSERRTAGPRDAQTDFWMRSRWGGEGITAASDDDQRTLNELRDVLPDERDTLTM